MWRKLLAFLGFRDYIAEADVVISKLEAAERDYQEAHDKYMSFSFID